MSDFDTERKFSTPLEWRNSIDWDDAPDGSEGGYDRHGNFIIPEAMKELVILRARVEKLEKAMRPFAEVPYVSNTFNRGVLTDDDFRRARARRNSSKNGE